MHLYFFRNVKVATRPAGQMTMHCHAMMVKNAQKMTTALMATALAHRSVAFLARNVAMTHVT